MENNTSNTENPTVSIEEDTSKLRHRKATEFKILIILSVILLVAIGNYLIYWQYTVKGSFYKVRLQNITIDKSSNLTSVKQELEYRAKNYQFSLSNPEETAHYSLADAGISVDIDASMQKALQEKTAGNYFQKLRFWRNINVKPVIKVDEDMYQSFSKSFATKTVSKPTNARLSFVGNDISIAQEQPGVAYYDGTLKEKLMDAARSLSPLAITLSKQTKNADITTERIKDIKPMIEKSLQQTVTLTIDGKIIVADASTIKKWIDLPDFSTAEKFEYEVNSGNIQKYIDDIVRPYVKKGKAQIELQRNDGTTLVIAKGVAGSDVLEKQAIAKEISTTLKNGKSYQKTLTVSTAPMQIVDAKTYDKWIVVDVTNKYMEAYEKDQVVNKFLVSAGAPATPTVLGQYTIRAKVRRQDMRGLNVDGSSYFQPNVEFVNYFYGGQAIHGNYWRPLSWFGNINSSHGCVGLPNPEAEWVYNWAPIGTPIIIHN